MHISLKKRWKAWAADGLDPMTDCVFISALGMVVVVFGIWMMFLLLLPMFMNAG